uniref:Putative secreted protein n=1 Tax=Amblyomma cajennense TaxID=34607 RepID=A0A023FBZ7_AMBCJ
MAVVRFAVFSLVLCLLACLAAGESKGYWSRPWFLGPSRYPWLAGASLNGFDYRHPGRPRPIPFLSPRSDPSDSSGSSSEMRKTKKTGKSKKRGGTKRRRRDIQKSV